jgi:hypothetical protein
VFLVFDREHGHIAMKIGRCGDANEVNVFALDGLSLVVGKMSDAEFLGRRACVVDARA